jgi:tripartite-type tricarboxylate transporter receptor subunit TctC
MQKIYALAAFAVTAGATLAIGPAAQAADFSGKKVQLIVASNPGGGTDRVGRLMAQYMSKYLAGKPNIVVKNTGSGGGKIRGANLLAKAKPDGLTIMQSDGSTLQPTTLKRKSVRYDPTKFRAIGAINRGGSILFMRKEAVPRLMDKSKKPAIIAAISGSRSWQAMPMWGAEFLGWNARWIPGYKGSGSMTKALRQGEVDAFATNNTYIIDELVKDGVVDLVVQVGQPSDAGYEPRASYPKVPLFPDMIKKAKLTKTQWQAYTSLVNPSLIDKWMGLTQGTPADFVAAWRSAYAAAYKDPDLQKVFSKEFSKDLTFISGKRVEEMIKEVSGVPEAAVKYSIKLKKKYGLSAR